MIHGARESRLMILTIVVIAMVLTVLPLPPFLVIVRPAFLVLVVLYWSTMTPHAFGIFLGWLSGLAIDVFQGAQLGEHALALAFITYVAVRFHLQVRASPIFQQSIYVFAGLLAYETLLWWIDGWSGHALNNPTRWLHAFTGALIWPLIVGVLGRTHSPR